MPPALIFDLDGTLIDSAPDIHGALLETLATFSLAPVTYAQTRSFIGRGVPKLIDQARAALDRPDDPDEAARMVTHFTEIYETAVSKTVLYPGVRETLDALRAGGHRLAICTNKPEAPTRAVMEHFGLMPLFEALAFGNGPYPRKPDPAPVQHLRRALGQEAALYIGDSETDAATAEAAGLAFLLFTQGYRKLPVEEIRHTARFDAFADLTALVAAQSPARLG